MKLADADTLGRGLWLFVGWAAWAFLAFAYVRSHGPLEKIIQAGPASAYLVGGWMVVSIPLLFFAVMYSVNGLRYRVRRPGV